MENGSTQACDPVGGLRGHRGQLVQGSFPVPLLDQVYLCICKKLLLLIPMATNTVS
jgi:hypothetical protein